MIFKVKHCLFASWTFLAAVQASSQGKVSSCQSTSSSNNASSTSLSTSPSAIYPPPGLLDSLSSMKIREDIHQSDLSKHAARADIEPPLTRTNPVSPATGVLASMRCIESVYRSLLLPPTPAIHQTVFTIQTSPPTSPSAVSGPGTAITPRTSSSAPPLHVDISIIWMMVITFITINTLSTIIGGIGNALIVVMLINIICALHLQPLQVDAHPDIHHAHHPHSMLHAARDPGRRPIGGLRPGPVDKIPCGPVKGTIGTKEGHFLKGVHRKIGGLKPALPVDEELYCDDWGDAVFGRAPPSKGTSLSDGDEEESEDEVDNIKDLVIIPTPPSDDKEEKTTIFSTTTSTLRVPVPDASVTATTYCLASSPSSSSTIPSETPSSATSSATPSSEAPYSTATETASSESILDRPSFEPPYYGQPKISSAVAPAVNIRTSFTYLFLLYLTGMMVCFLLGGSSYALSFLLISFALAAIIAGAEGAAVPGGYRRHDYGGRVAALNVGTTGVPGAVRWNSTSAEGGKIEDAGLKMLCGELFCHNWPNVNTSRATPRPKPTYDELVKRQATLFITVPPTSGVIKIEGPQIIPITVVSTAYIETEAATVTVDAVTEVVTRTKIFPPLSTKYISPGTSTTLSGPGVEQEPTVKTVTSGETTITVNATLPSSTSLAFPPPPPTTQTLRLTTTVTASPSSPVPDPSPSPSLLSSSTSSSSDLSSSSTPEPTIQPITSQASHLDPTKLYLSFAETNLYCFLFLFVGLNIALTTSHPLAFFWSMAALAVGGGMVLRK